MELGTVLGAEPYLLYVLVEITSIHGERSLTVKDPEAPNKHIEGFTERSNAMVLMKCSLQVTLSRCFLSFPYCLSCSYHV